MKKDIVMTDGDKLKEIRKKYGLKQDEISGKDITRNLISEIETGVANITKKTAEVIIKNLKEIGKKKGFKVTETVEYLMENQLVQATKILDNYILELKKLLISKDGSFIETLKAAKSFLANWNINEKMASIYELAGDYYYIQNEMYESIMYYEKTLTAIGKLLPSDELLQVFFKITKAYIHAGNYDKAIESSTFVIEHFDNLPLEYIRKFTYNRALVFKRLGKYELALVDIGKTESIVSKDDKKNYFIIIDTKAVCLYELERYNEALKLYNILLKTLDDSQIDKRIVMLINIAEVYIKLSDINRANELLSEVKNRLPFVSNGSCYEADIYYELGKIYKKTNDNVNGIKYYSIALETSKKQKNYVLATEILYELMECEDNVEGIDRIKNEAFVISSKSEKLPNKLIHKLINFYAVNNDVPKVLEINNFALQFD